MPETKSARKPAKRPRARTPPVSRAAKLASDVAILIGAAAGKNGTHDDHRVELARAGGGASPGEPVELILASGQRIELTFKQWERAHGDLKALVREELASLDAGTRAAVLDTLAASTGVAGENSLELSSSLHSIREILRERLPRCAVSREQPAGIAVEAILAVDDSSFWINGWMHDEDGLGEVIAVSPEGARVHVTENAFRYERPDVVEFYSGLGDNRTGRHGFTAHVRLPSPSRLASGWIAELRTSEGLELEIRCPAVKRDRSVVRATILGELASHGPIGGEPVESHGRDALTLLQERIVAESKVASIDTYGRPLRDPAVSIIVPLYRRLDFIEHQLLALSRGADLADAELIYVLDSTEQTDDLTKQARELFALYGMSFRVVNLSSGAGFAGANRHGVESARGKRLLLLNSDVIPDRPGWLRTMNDFYDGQRRIGALGPKLLYEDDSLQHAGLYFHRVAGGELWENAHCFKGLHRSFPAANVARAVPAVTAACMLVDRRLYEEVGGLPLHYVHGDYEDSELCLKLAEAGRENWYLPDVELYHLEGQSYSTDVRRVPSEYNMWLHSSLWGARIGEVMADFDPYSQTPQGGAPRT
jgi:O-antigen biosynthesis protein